MNGSRARDDPRHHLGGGSSVLDVVSGEAARLIGGIAAGVVASSLARACIDRLRTTA
jgi:hypothetical protein